MFWLFLLVGCFALGALLGAPWLPIRRREAMVVLELLDLKPGQTVLDLGSGDGSFLLLAARRGISGVGYELNPLLWLYSLGRTWPQRRLVKIHLANYWRVQWPPVDGVYVFLINRFMGRLHHKLQRELKSRVPVASYTFTIPDQKPLKSKDGVYLYYYGE